MTPRPVFIAGRSSGLGRAAAKLFSARAWKVVATMRNPEREKELAGLAGVVLLPLDITQPTPIERAAADAIRGGVDVVFNNAGYGMAGALPGVRDEKILPTVSTKPMGAVPPPKRLITHLF